MKCLFAAAAPFLLAAIAAGQAAPITLPASPSTVVWGYYSAKAKPVLTFIRETRFASRPFLPAVRPIDWKRKASRPPTFPLTMRTFTAK